MSTFEKFFFQKLITHAISTSLAHAHRGTIIMFIPVLAVSSSWTSLTWNCMYMHACRNYWSPARNLSEPKIQRCSVNTVFVMKKFTKDPSAPGVPPISVLCISVESIEVFDTNRVNAYKYELLGGQHTALARRIVAAKSPDNTLLQTVLAEVYACWSDMDDEAALRLASRHNTSNFIHKMTYRDYVSKISVSIIIIQ